MTENKDINLDSWDDFVGSWLKAEVVTEVPCKVPVTAVRGDLNQDGNPQVILTVNYKAKKFEFSLNKTNAKYVKEIAKLTPKQLVNKMLTLSKGKVFNPQTKARVDSLFIDKIE